MPFSLGVGETLEFSLSFRPRTLPAQEVQVIATAAGPPGFQPEPDSSSQAIVTLEADTVFGSSFESNENL